MLKKWIIVCLAYAATQYVGKSEEPKVRLSAETVAVEAKLTEQPNQIVLAVNGLCCRSCAIGIGKKVCKLDFIDTNALPQGVKVDRKNSLLTVAVKQNEKIDVPALAEAIRKAGYDPVRLYQRIENGSLKVTEIPDDI